MKDRQAHKQGPDRGYKLESKNQREIQTQNKYWDYTRNTNNKKTRESRWLGKKIKKKLPEEDSDNSETQNNKITIHKTQNATETHKKANKLASVAGWVPVLHLSI